MQLAGPACELYSRPLVQTFAGETEQTIFLAVSQCQPAPRTPRRDLFAVPTSAPHAPQRDYLLVATLVNHFTLITNTITVKGRSTAPMQKGPK